ncbi:MATE family efflux transporter [Actinomyces howellii]|uniref:Multidrug-efflux transporter n=1 Tax=Actinomyces howellii TaxID=52771 RepID=A0A3S4TAE0_9ACTO|nr:MATE family efflux transporter [Actinomyces howellii]VEG28856.1 Multidrug-efflux transporter [Actinomyces howellii]
MTAVGRRPSGALDRQILALALPALGALVAEPVFVLVDSAMVGHLGAASLAGLSLASTVLTTLVGLFVFLAYSTTATTARLFGAGDRRAGLRAGVDGLWLALLLGLGAAALLGACAPRVTGLLGAQDAVAVNAVAYLRASAGGLPGMLVVLAATGTLRGLLDTRTPFAVATAGAVLNVALNAVLIYGLGMGVAGSGLGTALSQTAMAVALGAPVLHAARREGVAVAPRIAGLGTSLGAGLPLLVRTISLRLALLATVWSATSLGPTALAAHQVVAAVWGLTAFALDALAIAAQALIGRALGAAQARAAGGTGSGPGATGTAPPEDPEGVGEVRAVLRRSLVWGVASGAVLGTAVAALSPWLPRLFSPEHAVVGAASPALLIAGTAMPMAGAVFLLDGVLMGAGDGRYLAWAGVVTLLPYLPLTALIAQGWPEPGTGALMWLWAAFGWVFMGARLATTGLRTRHLAAFAPRPS